MQTKQIKISNKTQELVNTIAAGIEARKQACIIASEENPKIANQVSTWSKIAKRINTSFAVAVQQTGKAIDLSRFASTLPNTMQHGNDSNFIAVYAVDKVLKMVQAVALRDMRGLQKIDCYSAQIIANALANHDSISAKGALMSLSRQIEVGELETVSDKLVTRGRAAITTASTQRSSTREMLRMLGLADLTKGKRDEAITLDPVKVEALRDIFNNKGEETEPEAV